MASTKSARHTTFLVMIYLNEKCQEGGGPFMAMLRTLFSPTLSKEEKLNILKEKYSIKFKQEDEKVNKFIEYVKQVNLEIGEENGEKRTRRTVIANMLRNGRDEKEIQMALGLPARQVSELIRDVQANSQEYLGK